MGGVPDGALGQHRARVAARGGRTTDELLEYIDNIMHTVRAEIGCLEGQLMRHMEEADCGLCKSAQEAPATNDNMQQDTAQRLEQLEQDLVLLTTRVAHMEELATNETALRQLQASLEHKIAAIEKGLGELELRMEQHCMTVAEGKGWDHDREQQLIASLEHGAATVSLLGMQLMQQRGELDELQQWKVRWAEKMHEGDQSGN